jgi:hypothetical protein
MDDIGTKALLAVLLVDFHVEVSVGAEARMLRHGCCACCTLQPFKCRILSDASKRRVHSLRPHSHRIIFHYASLEAAEGGSRQEDRLYDASLPQPPIE